MDRKPHTCYEFGPYTLDPLARTLVRQGTSLTLPPKTFDLLCLLLDSDGRVVSKTELMRALWPDTFVEEQSLAFQISTLRKALGNPAASWVATVPKHGYRFAYPIQRRSTDGDSLSREMSAGSLAVPRPQRFVSRQTTALAVLLVSTGLILLVRHFTQPTQPPSSTLGSAIPVTALPGIEKDPTLSPDGSQVAFAWNGGNQGNFDIYVKLIGPGDPVRLTTDPLPDERPAWSPDGQWIAFVRWTSRTTLRTYVIPARGGAERKVGEFEMTARNFSVGYLAWAPDSKSLICSGRPLSLSARGLWRVTVRDGFQRRLTTPAADQTDAGPAVSPDGRTLAFVRFTEGRGANLYLMPVTSDFTPAGEPRPRDTGEPVVTMPAWLPGGRELLYVERNFGGAVTVLKRTLAGSDRPAKTVNVGDSIGSLAVAKTGRLVYERRLRDANLWRVDFRGKVAQPLTNPSTYDEGTPDYSPDGKKIVFASSRSGTMEIFVANADGSNATQLTTMAASTTGYPRWSPDGGKIVFNSRIEGQSAIYLLELTEGTVRRLTPAGLRGRWPSWSRDGRSIYYSSDSTGRYELWKMGADGSGPVQITRDGGLAGQESVDRRWVFYTKGGGTTPSLWKTPVRGGRHTQVIGGLSFAYHFVVSAKAIFLTTGPTLQECVLELYDPVTGTRRILHKPDRNCGIGITVSPDERQVLYALVDDERSDLMVADFR